MELIKASKKVNHYFSKIREVLDAGIELKIYNRESLYEISDRLFFDDKKLIKFMDKVSAKYQGKVAEAKLERILRNRSRDSDRFSEAPKDFDQ